MTTSSSKPSSDSGVEVRPDSMPILVWLRQDLRLDDNPALAEAARSGRPVVPVFILSDRGSTWFPGGAACWWLHQSLNRFAEILADLDSRLVLLQGSAEKLLPEIARQHAVGDVYWNRCYEPAERKRQEQVEHALQRIGCGTREFPGALLIEPDQLRTKSDAPYQVFTPFWRSARQTLEFSPPVPAPPRLPAPPTWPESLSIEDLCLETKLDWKEGLAAEWDPGEQAALQAWEEFLGTGIGHYRETRNLPSQRGTSRLSPYLHHGEISPRRIYAEAETERARPCKRPKNYQENVDCYLSEIGWREFGYYVLFHFPHTDQQPLRDSFRDFPWEPHEQHLRAWQRGQTGFPIVDAGMRELWKTGWMHNRVRMIVASFLTKDLRIHWLEGARWFWDTLVDADLASNSLGWQWTSGCGADAAPYFRVFNPALQSKKFDESGDYIRRWCPELEQLPPKQIHEPHTAPPEVLRFAQVKLGHDYPEPIVDHATQRDLALASWEKIR